MEKAEALLTRSTAEKYWLDFTDFHEILYANLKNQKFHQNCPKFSETMRKTAIFELGAVQKRAQICQSCKS